MESALLREELVRSRKEAGFTQEQVAAALDWSPSKLIRVEGGKSGITRTDLTALMSQYGITSESKQERLQELARGAKERPWWSDYRDLLRDQYLTFVGYEAGASLLRHYHGGVFPGLVQLGEYAEVVTGGPDDLQPSPVPPPAIKLRLERQRHLAERADPPRMQFVVDEAVVRRQVGVRRDPGVQQRQIRHVVQLAKENQRIQIQVVPFGAGFHSGLFIAGFTLLEFDGPLDDVLYIEAGRNASQLVTGGELVSDYRAAYQEVMDEAMTPDRSLEFMLEVADELDAL